MRAEDRRLRGGTTTRYFWGEEADTTRANFWKSQIGHVRRVGSYPPNPFGLYDLIGNVREWVVDYYGGAIPASALVPEDGAGPSTASPRWTIR
mgnify:CR=1 FL=1